MGEFNHRDEGHLRLLIRRCYAHAEEADQAGKHTTGDVLWLAARALEELTGFREEGNTDVR